MTLRVLDLFCGLGGATNAFRDRGHEVLGIDNNPDLEPDRVADVRDLDADELQEEGPWDLVWASPPCPTFSVMTISVYHDAEGRPDHPRTHEALALVHDTLALIERLDPRAFVMENPLGMLRKYDFLGKYERRTITQCQYGRPIRKATDLWGGFPPTLDLRKPCSPGDPCHSSSRDQTNPDERPDRGEEVRAWKARETCPGGIGRPSSDGGAARSLIPYELSLELCEAMESFNGHWQDHSMKHQTEQQRLTEVTP